MFPLPAHFTEVIRPIVARYFAQNGRAAPEEPIVASFVQNLGHVIAERGLPPPLPEGDVGRPGSMPDEECAVLVARVVSENRDPLLVEAARQLVKACFYPEFANCRNSYREVGRDGACRRQELARVRGRISGAHCVDCPHWTSQSAAEHFELLRRAWRADPTDLERHRDVFLPEDFRVFRQWRHAAARRARDT